MGLVLVSLVMRVGVFGCSFSSVIGLAAGFLGAAWTPRFGVLYFFAGVLTVIPESLNAAHASSSACIRSLHSSSFVGIFPQ